jgi:hypothetical protein
MMDERKVINRFSRNFCNRTKKKNWFNRRKCRCKLLLEYGKSTKKNRVTWKVWRI